MEVERPIPSFKELKEALSDLELDQALTKAVEERLLEYRKFLTSEVRYLNNIVEQDHRFVKGKVKSKMNFKNFWGAQRTIRGYEVMNQIRKGLVRQIPKGDIKGQISFINKIFGLAA